MHCILLEIQKSLKRDEFKAHYKETGKNNLQTKDEIIDKQISQLGPGRDWKQSY